MISTILFFILKHGILLGIIITFFWNLKLDLTPIIYLHLIITLIISEYYIYVIHKSLFAYQERVRELRIRKAQETELINNFLKNKLDYEKSSSLAELISTIKDNNFLPKIIEKNQDKISEKMILAERLLEKLQHKEEIEELEQKREKISNNIKYLKEQENELTQTEEERKEELREEMNLEENKVFEESELNDERVNFLVEEGYQQTNQYSILEEGNTSIYIKPVLNHSKSHMYLVYELKQILEHRYEADDIMEHLTKDADITFKYNRKFYALEVETGSLLKKKNQAKEKVEYLNKKYKNRWMFVVTNRNDVAKYKKLGFVSERKQVTKNLDKLLKISTRDNQVSDNFVD